jgi:outer membrane protein assembly factor BamB
VRTPTVIGTVAGLVAVAAVVAVAVPVVRHSDALTTTIRTSADNPAVPETGPLPAAVRQLWTAPTGAAGAPVEGPTVISTGPDRVAGLDPRTGAERWSYERGNARLCSTSRQDGEVLAVFAKADGCRDLIALDAATGKRRWYRTLELRTDAVLTTGPAVGVATAGDRMIAFDTGGGLNRWTYTAAGCTLDPAVVGQAAVVTVARCAAGERRLIVHLPFADKDPWVGTLPPGSDPHVLTADERVTVLSGSALSTYSVTQDADQKVTAALTGEVPRDDRLTTTGTPVAVADGDFLVVWTGTTAVGIDARNRTVLWSAAATGPPTLAEGQVVLAGTGGFTVRPASTGAPVTTVPAGTPVPDRAGLSRIGRLVVVAGAGRLIAYG